MSFLLFKFEKCSDFFSPLHPQLLHARPGLLISGGPELQPGPVSRLHLQLQPQSSEEGPRGSATRDATSTLPEQEFHLHQRGS